MVAVGVVDAAFTAVAAVAGGWGSNRLDADLLRRGHAGGAPKWFAQAGHGGTVSSGLAL